MEACSKSEGKGEAKFRGSVAPRDSDSESSPGVTETERHILTTRSTTESQGLSQPRMGASGTPETIKCMCFPITDLNSQSG